MEVSSPYQLSISGSFDEMDPMKWIYISIIHATRIPPHVGMIIGNKYHSLTIKGQEVNVPVEALIRNNAVRKIPSVFIKIKSHPVYSTDYLKEHFISTIQQFQKVEAGVATCLSPIKLFFEETYGVDVKEVNYIFDLLPKLEKSGLIESVSAMFIEEKVFHLPVYNMNELVVGISKANDEAQKILKVLQG